MRTNPVSRALVNDNRYVIALSLLIIAITSFFSFISVDKNIFGDEGWYMYLWIHKSTSTAVRTHFLFGGLDFLNNIYYSRLAGLLLRFVGSLVLTFGFYRWLKIRQGVYASPVVIFALSLLMTTIQPSTYVLSYMSLASVIGISAIGVFFLALTYDKRWLYILSGFILAIYFPVKITSLILALPMAVACYLAADGDRGHKFVCTLWAAAGALLFLLIYICLIENPSQIFDMITSNAQGLENDPSHSPKALFVWCFFTMLDYLYLIVGPVIVVTALHFCKSSKAKRWIVAAAIAVAIGWLVYQIPRQPSMYRVYLQFDNLAWMLAIVLITACCYNRKGWTVTAPLIILLLAPACWAFGSDVSFTLHHYHDCGAVVLGAAALLGENWQKAFTRAISALFLAIIVVFAVSGFKVENTMRVRYFPENNYPVQATSLGLPDKIKINEEQAEEIEFFRDNIPAGSEVLASVNNWSAVYLLRLDAVSDKFAYMKTINYRELIDQALERNEAVCILYMAEPVFFTDSGWNDLVEDLKTDHNVVILRHKDKMLAIVRKGS